MRRKGWYCGGFAFTPGHGDVPCMHRKLKDAACSVFWCNLFLVRQPKRKLHDAFFRLFICRECQKNPANSRVPEVTKKVTWTDVRVTNHLLVIQFSGLSQTLDFPIDASIHHSAKSVNGKSLQVADLFRNHTLTRGAWNHRESAMCIYYTSDVPDNQADEWAQCTENTRLHRIPRNTRA